ncbi:MAG: hypothetical protein V4489_09865 [Chlamydiota bacterium]
MKTKSDNPEDFGNASEYSFLWGKYRLDLSTTYDLSFSLAQNVIREMLDEYYSGTGSTLGNLYFEGLTLTADFAF